MNSNPHVNISSGYVANSPNLKVLERIVCLDKIYSIQTSQKVLLCIFLLHRHWGLMLWSWNAGSLKIYRFSWYWFRMANISTLYYTLGIMIMNIEGFNYMRNHVYCPSIVKTYYICKSIIRSKKPPCIILLLTCQIVIGRKKLRTILIHMT